MGLIALPSTHSADCTASLLPICAKNENSNSLQFFDAPPLSVGPFRLTTLSSQPPHVVQARSNSFQFFSHNETAKHSTDLAAAMDGAGVCTATLICKNKRHKARRREGDKWVFTSFFVVAEVLSIIRLSAD